MSVVHEPAHDQHAMGFQTFKGLLLMKKAPDAGETGRRNRVGVAVVGLGMHEPNALAPQPAGEPNSSSRIPALARCHGDEVNLATRFAQLLAEHSEVSQAKKNRMERRRKVTGNNRSEILGAANGHADETISYPRFPKAKARCAKSGSMNFRGAGTSKQSISSRWVDRLKDAWPDRWTASSRRGENPLAHDRQDFRDGFFHAQEISAHFEIRRIGRFVDGRDPGDRISPSGCGPVKALRVN